MVVRNARGIMSDAGMAVPLPDQVRLLKLIDDVGSMTLSEASGAMHASGEPLGAILASAAHRSSGWIGSRP